MRFGKFFAVSVLALSSTGLFAFSKATHMPQMWDGINLATDVYLPDTDDSPWPTVLIRTPYDKDNIGSDDVSLFTDQNGYALVVQNTRGAMIRKELTRCSWMTPGARRNATATIAWSGWRSSRGATVR